MKFKTAAFAVALSAGVGLAVQDFGVPPGVPNVFSSGEVAVADDVNENFDWVEDELAQLEITDNSHDALINALAAATKQRSQSFSALGYLGYGDCGGGPLQGENDELGGCPGWIGWMDLPAPSDWDTLTDLTVTFTLINYVDDSQSPQDIDIDVYGDLIGSGDLAFDGFCFPGPDTTYDFYAAASVSVPAVQPPPLLGGGPSTPSGDAYLVSTSFTISSGLLSGGPNPFSDPKHIRVNFFEPSGPLFVGKGGGGGTDPCLFFASNHVLDWDSLFNLDLFVTMEYTAL